METCQLYSLFILTVSLHLRNSLVRKLGTPFAKYKLTVGTLNDIFVFMILFVLNNMLIFVGLGITMIFFRYQLYEIANVVVLFHNECLEMKNFSKI